MDTAASGQDQGKQAKGRTLPSRSFPPFSFRDKVSCIGFGLTFAWFLILLVGPLPSLGFQASDQEIHFLKAFFLLGLTLSCCIMIPLSKALLVGKGETTACLIALVLTLQGGAFAHLFFPSNLLWLSWILAGLGIGISLVLWTKYMTMIQMRKLLFLHGLSFALAGVFFLLSFLIPKGNVVLLLLPLISACLFLLLRSDQDLRTELLRSRLMGTFSAWGYIKNNQLFSLGCNLVFGLVLCYITSNPFVLSSPLCIGGAILLSAILYVLNIYLRTRNFGHIIYNLSIPIVFVCLAGMLACPGAMGKYIFLGIFLFHFVWSDLHGLTTAVVSSRVHKELFAGFFSVTQSSNYLAILVGWLLAYWASFISETDMGIILATALCFALQSLLISGAFYDRDRLTLALSYAIGADDYNRLSQTEPIQRFFDEDDLFDGKSRESNVEVVETTRIEDPLEEAIETIARDYHLSRREHDVFLYLAHGRNAEYIANKLVISMATAKSHTYNIYTKLSVHSRQELMDLVESMAPPPPEK